MQTIWPYESLFTLKTQSLQVQTPPVAACVVQTSRNGLSRVKRNWGHGQAQKTGQITKIIAPYCSISGFVMASHHNFMIMIPIDILLITYAPL